MSEHTTLDAAVAQAQRWKGHAWIIDSSGRTVAEWTGFLLENQVLLKNRKPGYCLENVHNPGTTVTFHHCTRKAVKDGFCRIHHPDAVEKRQKEINDRWEARQKRDPLFLAHERIKKLEKENRVLRDKLKSFNHADHLPDGK